MHELSGTQKLIKMFVSKETFAAMEVESKEWKVQCSHCGHERSIWDMGGIRWKAHGEKALYRYCVNCDQSSLLKVYKKTSAG